MSVRSSIPFFGQAWELVVYYTTADGSTQSETISTDSWEPEALRITFEILQSTLSSPWWYADIVIYNLNATDIQNILFNATRVTLKAGFQTGPASPAKIIWDSPILQVLYDQQDVVDQRVTLHCAANPLTMDGTIAFSMGQYASQAQLLAKAAAAINLPTISDSQGTLSTYAQQALATKQYPRGNTVFGKMGGYLDQVAGDQFMTTFRDGAQAYMTEYSDGTVPPPDLIYSPPPPPGSNWSLPPSTTQTIVGTPRQTQQGVIFTVLLDPRLQVKLPIQVVSLVRALPTQLTINPDINQQYVTPLNANLTFFVAQIRHSGDSRGNDWTTEVTGYSTQYASSLLNGSYAASGG